MKKLALAFFGGLLALTFLLPAVARADVNEFVIHRFFARYELNNQQPGGDMTVREKIELSFSDQNHGILRAVPKKYEGHNLDLEVLSVERDGESEAYSIYDDSNGNAIIKIGSANTMITGPHRYDITYKLQGVIHFLADHDEFYWDVNGDDWGQVFESVSAEVVMPEGWTNTGLDSSCYTGQRDAQESNCIIIEEGEVISAGTTQLLNPRQTLTVAVPIQKNFFQPVTWQDRLKDNWLQLSGLFLAPLLIGGTALRVWLRKGKEYAGRGVIVPQHQPPEGLTPAEVGLIADFKTDGRDLSATLIDLAVRGYVRIHDDQKKRLLGSVKHNFTFELLNNDFTKLKGHERALLAAMFSPSKNKLTQLVKLALTSPDILSKNIEDIPKSLTTEAQAGAIMAFKDIDRTGFQAAAEVIRRSLAETLSSEHGYFENNPRKASGGLMIAFFVLIFFGIIFHPGWGWTVGLLLGAIICFIFGLLMPKRSHLGTGVYEHIEGLKLYMNTAEKDRLKMLQSVERPYAPPERTVKLYETLLPYAVALGIEKSWSNQFADIYTKPPDWYQGNWAHFSMHSFSSGLSQGVSALNTSFSAQSSSSGSGAGGGGSAGGGGGGGGGGGW